MSMKRQKTSGGAAVAPAAAPHRERVESARRTGCDRESHSPSSSVCASRGAPASEREWLLRGKWCGFYDGSFAPHLASLGVKPGSLDSQSAMAALPWRSGKPSSQLVEYLAGGGVARGAACVELGCGTGENLVCLAGAFRNVTGVDVSPIAMRIASEAVARAGLNAQ